MDQRRRSTAQLIVRIFAAAFIASVTMWAAVAAAEKPLLAAMAWLKPDDRLTALSDTDAPQLSPEVRDSLTVQMGRIAFQTPVLLGGQAAKAGLSCNSCHRSGRGNPQFFFPDVSSAPGTADVTNSFFSSYRGNGHFDPIIIPDLTAQGKVSHDPDTKELEIFVRGLIVEEFDGAEPAPVILGALATYVRALRKSEVGSERSSHGALGRHLDEAQSAVTIASGLLQSGETETSRFYLSAARHQLRLIHERFAGARLKKTRKKLLAFDRRILMIQQQLDSPEHKTASLQHMQRWTQHFARQAGKIRKQEQWSLFDHERLQSALKDGQRQQ